MDGGALNVAVAVGPNLVGALAADEGVVVRYRAIGIEADDRAEMVGRILGLLHVEAFAERDEKFAVRREGQPRAEMILA